MPDRVSTLDLVGDGLTLLTGPRSEGWAGALAGLRTRAPLSTHTLPAATAEALGVEPTGAVMVRPDALPVGQWPEAVVPLVIDGVPGL